MTELDSQTIIWLKSLKLNKNLKSLADFQNGYNFSLIFDKLNLSRGRKYKNNNDLACIFHNYKNTKDLLQQNFNIDFPINNIIYKTQQLLKVLKNQCIKYVQLKKQNAIKNITSSLSNINPKQQKLFNNRQKQISKLMNQTDKYLPKKIQDIQKKLDKFKQEKIRHQLFALQERKKQIQQNRRLIQQHRQYQINKIRNNNAFMKTQQHHIYDIWTKTENIKKLRIDKEQQFNRFMQQKKDNFYKSLKDQEIKNYQNGLEAFQLNCIRQGIDLQHDPDKPSKTAQTEFNKIVVMERIKDNIKKQQQNKKQRLKRQNRKKIDTKQAKQQSDALWSQINLIDKYNKLINTNHKKCENIYKIQQRKNSQKQTIKSKYKKKQFIDLPKFGNQQQRQAQQRKNRIQYYKKDIQKLQQRYNKHKSYAQQILQCFIHVTINFQDKFIQNNGFTYHQWKSIQKAFMEYSGYQNNKNNQNIKIDYSNYQQQMKSYLSLTGNWQIFQQNQLYPNKSLGLILNKLIQKCYPNFQLQQKNNIPLAMPLKIGFNGNRLTGKTTLINKLLQKYKIQLIDPINIIKQALELAQPPVQDNKKGAKKDTKKVQEDTPQKIALKEFGISLSEKVPSLASITPQICIQAIKFKIKSLFSMKNRDQIIQQYEEAEEKEKQRHIQALKDFDQQQKKPKKDTKKVGNQIPQEPPKQNNYFYCKGFLIDSYQLTFQNLRLLERQLNNYIDPSQKLNPKAQQLKSSLSILISFPKKQPIKSLLNGTFDLIFELNTEQQQLQKRNKGRKIDPQTQIVYHPEYNPIPTDVKGLAQRLIQIEPIQLEDNTKNYEKSKQFYSYFGDNRNQELAYHCLQNNNSIDQTLNNIKSIIQRRLLSKYQDIKQWKLNNKKEQKLNQQENRNEDQQQININVKQQQIQINNEQSNPIINIIQTIPKDLGQKLLKRFIEYSQNYQYKIKQTLYQLDQVRNSFGKDLFQLQKNFISIINRPDDKAGKILSFQDNYNKLHTQKISIVKDSQASKHLIEKLDQLYNSLWESLEIKKNQAVNQRQKLLTSNWLNLQINKIVQIAQKLLQIQLNYLIDKIYFLFGINCSNNNLSIDFLPQYLSIGIDPKLQPIQSVFLQDFERNDRLDYIFNQFGKCVNEILQWSQKKQKKLKIVQSNQFTDFVNMMVNKQKINIASKVKSIENQINCRILEQKAYFYVLIDKMDDWIIFGIKNQNDSGYEIFKSLKKSITQAKKSTLKDMHSRLITEMHRPIRQLSYHPIHMCIETQKTKIPIFSLRIFFQEIRCLATRQGKIELKEFILYFNKRKRSKLLPDSLLSIDYDTLHQYLVAEEAIDFRQLAFAMLLINQQVYDQTQINDYIKSFEDNYGTRGKITLEQFEMIPMNQSKEQESLIREIVFQIFREDYSSEMDFQFVHLDSENVQ